MGTSEVSTSGRSRTLALGAAAAVAVGLVGAFGSIIGAQSAIEPIGLEVVSVDEVGAIHEVPGAASPAISDTGGVVAYETVIAPTDVATDGDPDAAAADVLSTSRRVWIRDRVDEISRPVAELGSVAPGVSGDGCVVAYSVVGADDADVSLTVIDRCALTADLPLPLGTVLDTVDLDVAASGPAATDTIDPLATEAEAPIVTTRVAPPALSLDGTTIVWSTGREIRRYEIPAPDEPYVRTDTFDSSAEASPDVVTGAAVDVSADGRSIVFLAGPGSAPFAPIPANVYLWTLPTTAVTPPAPPPEPELVSLTAAGEPSTFDAASPAISADGTFVVFESTGTDLAVVGASSVITPYVVGVDRIAGTAQILVDDATRPALSADANHVAYQRGDAIRLLSSGVDSVADVELGELVTARPTGPIAVSQYARWLVFASAENLAPDPAAADDPTPGTVLWAADRSASSPDVVDTTTTTTTTTIPSTPTVPTTPTTVAPPSTEPEVTSSPTVPATTLAPTPITPRYPSVASSFPTVVYPSAPNRSSSSRSYSSSFSTGSFGVTDVSASATPALFEPTVVVVGRRTQPVTLTNATSGAIGVTAASVTPTGAFSIVSDGCVGLRLTPGASCSIEVQFAPVEVGVTSAIAMFELGDGSVVTALLDGEGVPDPTLDLVPAVAGAGQTVTVFGAGFPSGSTVELTQPGVATPQSVAVDADGTFAYVVVVLPNTPTGPVLLTVAGQPDEFADVAAELLVSSRGSTSGGAALRGSSLAS